MKFEDLPDEAKIVINLLEQHKIVIKKPDKIIRQTASRKVLLNMQTDEFAEFCFPGRENSLIRAFYKRLQFKLAKYMQYNSVDALFEKTKQNHVNPPTSVSTGNLGMGTMQIDPSKVGQNLTSICDFQLPPGFSIKFTGDVRLHRVVFQSNEATATIPTDSDLYNSLRSKIRDFKDENPLNYCKLENFTVGLSKTGKVQLYVKCDLSNARDAFVSDFSFLDFESATLFLRSLNPTPEIEVGMPYTGDTDLLSKAKLKVSIPRADGKGFEVVWLWEDGSDTLREIDVRGNGPTAYNLAVLIADRLRMMAFMSETDNCLSRIQSLLKFQVKLMLDDIPAQKIDDRETVQTGQDGQVDNGHGD